MSKPVQFTLFVLTITLVSCASPSRQSMSVIPICSSMAECGLHANQRVRVAAVYRVWDPLPERARNQSPALEVRLVFASGEEGPYLGAWGYDGHFRSPAEISQFEGKPVWVTGTFLIKMPPNRTDPVEAAALDGPCLHPVERITLAPP